MKIKLLSLIVVLSITFGVKAQTITTVAGNGIQGYNGDNIPATSAEFNLPNFLAIDFAGNVYICDYQNNRIRKLSTNGIITTVAGTGGLGFSGDGGPATLAELHNPCGLAVDGFGNLYIADQGNERIRKVDIKGIINTVAGNGIKGFSGDGGSATSAQFSGPTRISFDAFGNLYITDQGNVRIRKVDTNGIINTVAGNGKNGNSGDGINADSAKLHYPDGVVVDVSGNIYIVEVGSYKVRKVDKYGILSTVAGNGIKGYSGDGGAAISAQLDFPVSLALDALGNLYIADEGSNVIRKVDTNGQINTIVGSGAFGNCVDGVSADSAALHEPSDLAFDTLGNLYFIDFINERVCKVSGLNNKIPPSLSIDLKDTTSCSFTVDVPIRGNKLYHVSKITGTIGWDTTYLSIGRVKFAKVGIVLDSFALDLSNISIGKLGINWSNQAPQSLTDSAPLITLTFYPKKNFSGGTGIWFDSSLYNLEIDTAIGVAATKATFNDGWVLLSDTPTVVQVGNILQCFAGCAPIHYQWYDNNGNPIYGDTLNYITPTNGGSYTCTVTYINGNRVSSLPTHFVLPVTLITFKASPIPTKEGLSKQVLLSWFTASEINTSHFNIQRSINGKDFTTIDSVNAKGASSYRYYDIPSLGARGLYYRLQIIDKDGTLSYSEIRELSIINSPLSISPNPAKNFVNIAGSNLKEVSIVDLYGRILKTEVINTNSTQLPVNNLTKGIYMVKAIMIDGSIKTEKLVVE